MVTVKEIVEDPVYFVKRNSIYASGKLVAHSLGHAIGDNLAPLVASAGGAAAGLAPSLGQLAIVGGASGISAALVQLDYYHKKTSLVEEYKEELAMKLNKSPKDLSASDIDLIAKGDPKKGIVRNSVIAEELGKAKKERNIGVVFSFIATMAALALVPALMPAAPGLLELAGASGAQLLQLATNTGVGLLIYNAVKMPLHWIGSKIFGLDKHTTHDRIEHIKLDREAGKVISQEQVLSIFAHARSDVNDLIVNRYGLPFDELVLSEKQRAVAEIGQLIPLERITSDINRGKVNVSELAFAVDGQISGVRHAGEKHAKKPGLFQGMYTKVRQALSFSPNPDVKVIGMAMHSKHSASAVAYAETSASGPSHVDRLGRQKFDKSAGYVKLIEQLDQQSNAPSTQTLQ
jgi:hypothetical protein